MEFELYREMMDEKGESQNERIHKNLDAYANMDAEQQLRDQFETLMQNMRDQRKLLHKGLEERQNMIHQQYEQVLAKYPGASEKLKSKKGADALNRIIEKRKEEEAEEDDDEEEVDFDTYNRQMDERIQQEIRAERVRAEKGDWISEDRLNRAKGE